MAGQRHKGFTLIETIAAVVMLAIAIGPMTWAIREAHIQRIDPVMASRARWLASEKLEDILADHHSSTRGYDFLANSSYPQEASVSGFTSFSRSVSISETGPDLVSAGTGYKKIQVDISWDDSRGKTRTFSLASVMTESSP